MDWADLENCCTAVAWADFAVGGKENVVFGGEWFHSSFTPRLTSVVRSGMGMHIPDAAWQKELGAAFPPRACDPRCFCQTCQAPHRQAEASFSDKLLR